MAKSPPSKTRRGVTLDIVRKLALRFPGTYESTSYGTLAFKVGSKLLARLHQNGSDLVIRIGMDERERLLEHDPDTFHITDHYRNYPAMLIRMDMIEPQRLEYLLEQAWRSYAPRKLIKAYDEAE